jgi:hypothetical protein
MIIIEIATIKYGNGPSIAITELNPLAISNDIFNQMMKLSIFLKQTKILPAVKAMYATENRHIYSMNCLLRLYSKNIIPKTPASTMARTAVLNLSSREKALRSPAPIINGNRIYLSSRKQ